MGKPQIPKGEFKHSMMDPQFGQLVPADFPDERDAIHIATFAAYAAEDLEPGDHVGLTTPEPDVVGKSEIAPIGIVDAFLTETVKKGERFWVFLYPGTIKSLRHSWTHPGIDKKQKLIDALTPWHQRMQQFATSLGNRDREEDWNEEIEEYEVINEGTPITVDDVLEAAKAYLETGEYWNEGGLFEGRGLYPEFWTDFEIITGIPVPENDRNNFFTCSC
jgi:hypothetical protein